jgi:transcription elongation GreA/GreB family factor
MTYEIVLPGDGNAGTRCVSADSGLGGAVLGAQVGDVVEVNASGTRSSVTVIAIE